MRIILSILFLLLPSILFSNNTPTCNLRNGLWLSTYNIRGYSRHYPRNHDDYDILEREYAKSRYLYGSGRVDTINTIGRNNNPFQPNPDERYLSIFEGYIFIPHDGEYSFAVNGDDAVEVIIDNSYLGWYGGHGADRTSHNQIFTLGKGYHRLKFRHQEWSGADNYQLYWKRPGDSGYSIVSKSNLFHCIPPKPLAEYRMDSCLWSGVQGEVKDSSGNDLHGTAENGANTDNGWLCKAGVFDGIDDKIKVRDHNRLAIRGDITIAAWIKTTKRRGSIVAKVNVRNPWNGYVLSVGKYEGNNKLGFWIGNGRDTQQWYLSRGQDLTDGKWHFVAVALQGRKLRFYIDGQLDDTQNIRGGKLKGSRKDFQIGSNPEGSTPPFNGKIDEVKIYDKAIDDKIIQQIYNNERKGRNWDGTRRSCAGCTPTCNLRNGLWLSTYNIRGYSRHYPHNHDEYDILEREYAKSRYLYGRGRVDTINTTGRNNNPFQPNPDERYLSIFEGYIFIPHDGEYSFAVNGDDAVEVIIDNSYLGWYGGHGADRTSHNQIFTLGKGYHRLKFRHQEWSGADNYQLYWKRPGDSGYSIVPKSNIFYCRQFRVSYKFDAWDIFRDSEDRNISTKIVAKNFKLRLASLNEDNSDYQEFNGTVCSRIVKEDDDNLTRWQKNLFLDKNRSDQTPQGDPQFNITQAVKKAKVEIVWKADVDESCPLSNEDNETNSTDNFAVRPLRYEIVLEPSTKLIAGSDFKLKFFAKNAIDGLSSGYNEPINSTFELNMSYEKPKCTKGDFVPTIKDGWSFADGNKTFDSIRYDEVNEFNITIAEKDDCNRRFSEVDCKDKNISGYWNSDENTTIALYTKANIVVRPHHFEVKTILYNFDEEKNFTYLSQDLNMSARIELNITAQNRQNETTKNYNTECYAKDINITLIHTPVISSNLAHLLYILQDAYEVDETNKTIGKNENFSITNYSKANFTIEHNGSTHLTLFFNFDRRASEPVEPFAFKVLEVNVTDLEANGTTKNIHEAASFYYARLKSNDLSTDKTEDNVTLPLLVYHSDRGGVEVLEGWEEMRDHRDKDGNITRLLPKKGFALGDPDSSITATATLISGSGYYQVQIDNPSKEQQAYIHLDIPSWLWYTYDASKNYVYDPSSDCSQHPCIQYRFFKSLAKLIKSGSVTGVDFEQNISRNKRGVRIFR